MLLAFVPGCAEDTAEQLRIVADCGNFVFPTGVDLVWYHREVMFGDSVAEAVVDIPTGQLSDFKERSKLVEFAPGVPTRWKESFWQGSGQIELLSDVERNQRLVEVNQTPARAVIVHDRGSDSPRVFVRAAC
ncbi:hypothetical protein [Nocardia sp. NPDC048505]|uniref:hypothetical protein n=1 Tax=unclassified Nocardia TaxID=2637762 RepID=UPI003406D849